MRGDLNEQQQHAMNIQNLNLLDKIVIWRDKSLVIWSQILFDACISIAVK